MYIRIQNFEGAENESFFLWGARQTGKSTLLKKLYPDSLWFDLLLTDVYERFLKHPAQLREIVIASESKKPIYPRR
jgi:predicted AAA+ superfamily ATPase